MPGARIVLLALSPRVAPGLLTWPAWEVLRSADEVIASSAEHPHRDALEQAGVDVTVAAEPPRALAERLIAAAAEATVVLLDDVDLDVAGDRAAALAAALSARADAGAPVPDVEVLAGSYDVPGARLLDLVTVMDRLRSPGGCPWDREQTHTSLVGYLLEEAYETVEAVETGDLDGLREELGDLLLQVAFHARIGEEHAESPWSIDDVAGGIVEKLVRRHPHVFGDASAASAADVEANWETIKLAEKGRTSAVEGVPLAQPALALADKLLGRAAKHGIDAVVSPPALPVDVTPDDVGVGDLLLGVVALARSHGVDAEGALRAAARRYADRVRAVEAAGR